jgi:hypothetical protein
MMLQEMKISTPFSKALTNSKGKVYAEKSRAVSAPEQCPDASTLGEFNRGAKGSGARAR